MIVTSSHYSLDMLLEIFFANHFDTPYSKYSIGRIKFNEFSLLVLNKDEG